MLTYLFFCQQVNKIEVFFLDFVVYVGLQETAKMSWEKIAGNTR